MLGIAFVCLFLAFGFLIVRFLLPRTQCVVRGYVGFGLGWMLMMWLPALWAFVFSFGVKAHLAALLTIAFLTLICFFLRDQRPVRKMEDWDKRALRLLLITALPLLLLSVYLEYTHTLRPDAKGNLFVGQSTYGDLQLHLAIASSAIHAKFPLQNSLLSGELLVYPHLSDTCASTLYLLGLPLNTAMVVSAGFMLALVFVGFFLLAFRLCRERGAAVLAFFLLFLNGGLGILYTLDAKVENGTVTGFLANLKTVMEGYYKTPTNQPDPYNLRWVNIICDMLVPQRAILGGWSVLLPTLNLLLPRACRLREEDGEKPLRKLTPWFLTAILAGSLPLIHTHSYLALVLASAGMALYGFFTEEKQERIRFLLPWICYAGIAAVLSVPQLIGYTFRQTGSSDHFIRLWFNWANNRNGNGKLVDLYFWFYIKNIGIPYLLILMAALRRKPKEKLISPEETAELHKSRTLLIGGFSIYVIAELIRFQPNVYDNNKLFYVWFLICLPMAADVAMKLWQKLTGIPGKSLLAAVFLFLCFAASTLSLARECVSNYQVYSRQDVTTAEYVRDNTPEHCIFLTGTHHLNPISALAGRAIICGPDLFLYFHGYSTGSLQQQIAAFYEQPNENLDFLQKSGAAYIYASAYEYSNYTVNETILDELFPVIYESEAGHKIWQVTQE